MQIRFMTFNIQHGIDYLKQKAKGPHGDDSQDEVSLKMMADVIREQKADIIGLNEVRGRGISPGYIAQAEEMAALLGYHCYFARALNFGGKDPYGNAESGIQFSDTLSGLYGYYRGTAYAKCQCIRCSNSFSAAC